MDHPDNKLEGIIEQRDLMKSPRPDEIFQARQQKGGKEIIAIIRKLFSLEWSQINTE